MSKSSSPSGKKGKKNRANWTTSQTSFLVSMMKEYSDVGKYRGQNGWTKEGWQAMTNRLNLKPPGANFTVPQLKDREQRLKKDHNVVKSILEKSGFGWDPVNGVPTAPDEKWDELSAEQRKWRHKAFHHYDILYEIYEGKISDGKRCKRTTDGSKETPNNMSHFAEEESFTEKVLRAAGLDSPKPTIPGPGSSMPGYDYNNDIYGTDVDVGYGAYSGTGASNEKNVSAEDDDSRRKRLRNSKGSDEGSDKNKAKKGKDGMIEDLISVRKDELEAYKEMKTKQIDIELAKMEKNDPKTDPYGMPNCIGKLKTLGLTPSEQLKMIEHLKADILNRQTFMEVGDDVLLEIIKAVVPQQG